MKLVELGSHCAEHILFPISFKQSVQHENSYRHPKVKYCYGDKPPDLQVIVSWHQGPVDVIPFVHWTLLFSRIVNLLWKKRIFFTFFSFLFWQAAVIAKGLLSIARGVCALETNPVLHFHQCSFWFDGTNGDIRLERQQRDQVVLRRGEAEDAVCDSFYGVSQELFLSTCRHDTRCQWSRELLTVIRKAAAVILSLCSHVILPVGILSELPSHWFFHRGKIVLEVSSIELNIWS